MLEQFPPDMQTHRDRYITSEFNLSGMQSITFRKWSTNAVTQPTSIVPVKCSLTVLC